MGELRDLGTLASSHGARLGSSYFTFFTVTLAGSSVSRHRSASFVPIPASITPVVSPSFCDAMESSDDTSSSPGSQSPSLSSSLPSPMRSAPSLGKDCPCVGCCGLTGLSGFSFPAWQKAALAVEHMPLPVPLRPYLVVLPTDVECSSRRRPPANLPLRISY